MKTVNQVINDLLTAIENNRFKFKFGDDRGVLIFEEFGDGGLKLFKDGIRNPYVFFMNEYIWFNNERESEIRNISERIKAIFSKATEALQQEALQKIESILNPQF